MVDRYGPFQYSTASSMATAVDLPNQPPIINRQRGSVNRSRLMVSKEFEEFRALLREKAYRRLILATDHGLSFSKRGLTQGDSGVFERAIFRVERD